MLLYLCFFYTYWCVCLCVCMCSLAYLNLHRINISIFICFSKRKWMGEYVEREIKDLGLEAYGCGLFLIWCHCWDIINAAFSFVIYGYLS